MAKDIRQTASMVVQGYTVRYGHLVGDEMPETTFQPWTGSHQRQLQALEKGGFIKYPICLRYGYKKGLEIIDRPSRVWMARTANVMLPVFVSDFTGDYHIDWAEIADILAAIEAIKHPINHPPNFGVGGMTYRAP